MAACFNREVKRLFPLNNISALLTLFKIQLDSTREPNLALLSIIVGAVENQLTVNRSLNLEVERQLDEDAREIFPVIELRSVEALYTKFTSLIKGSIDLSEYRREKYATRELVKKVSDVVWGSLTRSFYKDRAHLQSLYSYLTGSKLDCFGVAFAVVAACQVLGFSDVHLALSEDHAWVIFGKTGSETAEITWHGKGNEDKRGQPITVGVKDKSWLYLNGHSVICTRHMEVVAMVSGINPSISAATDSAELGMFQQELLWMLYDMNHLTKYPMALGNLGDLEEISPTYGKKSAESLFREAILSAKTYYNDRHVYPYTYLGGFLYRSKRYKEGLQVWANAADVIRHYNYTREDEEIYKEFLEIANELIPFVIKVSVETYPSQTLLRDPKCFANLLRFYDGLCEWEEGSSTPVLHIGWAKPLVNTISKFDSHVRSIVNIVNQNLDDEHDENNEIVDRNNGANHKKSIRRGEGVKKCELDSKISPRDSENKTKQTDIDSVVLSNGSLNTNGLTHSSTDKSNHDETGKQSVETKVNADTNNNSNGSAKANDAKNSSDLIDKLENELDGKKCDVTTNPNIAALAAHCGDNILNPDYLLGGQDPPFSSRLSTSSESSSTPIDSKVDCSEFLSAKSNGDSPFPGMTIDSVMKAESPTEFALANRKSQIAGGGDVKANVTLRSRKMMGLKDLLLAEKLNVSAIQLQLTAQSQVHVMKRGGGGRHSVGDVDFIGGGRSTKRSRRD